MRKNLKAVVLPVFLLVAVGCATAPRSRNLKYEALAESYARLANLPETEVVVTEAPTPADPIAVVQALIDTAISFEKSIDGAVLFAPWTDHPRFPSLRNAFVDELVVGGLVVPTDRLVLIRWQPTGHRPLETYGLTEADGTPKFDSVLAKAIVTFDHTNETRAGSWTYRDTYVASAITGPIYEVWVEARINTSRCHINNDDPHNVRAIERKLRTFWVEINCLAPGVEPYGKNHPACANHGHRPGEEDCIDFAAHCKTVTGPGASGNLRLSASASTTQTVYPAFPI